MKPKDTSRDLHPVVADYVSTDLDLGAVLRRHASLNEDIIQAMILLETYLRDRQSANAAFLAARRVELKGHDSALCALFLCVWALACLSQLPSVPERRAEAATLLHRARALISAPVPPSVKAFVLLVEARLLGIDGNRRKQEDTIRRSLRIFPPDSVRRRWAVLELADLMARMGRISEIDHDLSRLSGTRDIDWLQLINAVETGRLQYASTLAARLGAPAASGAGPPAARRYLRLLDLMLDTSALNLPAPPDAPRGAPDWALVIHCLLNRATHQALRWARLCENNESLSVKGVGCVSFNLIRSELAERNAAGARRLLELRRNAGNCHYLDDFFYARATLLEDDFDGSSRLFARALTRAEHYSAMGRLDFEIRLSAELSRDTVFRLTRTSDALRSVSTSSDSPTPGEEEPHTSDSSASVRSGLGRIVGTSRETRALKSQISKLAPLDVPVLITGETGTGKELTAQALHESSSRKNEPFVAINCGAISETLLESELFGHEKGAFSGASAAHRGLFEEAGKGSILLDEIGDISPSLQVALLRILETGEIRPVGSTKIRKVSCRILASTNADLKQLAENGRFRRDILYRLQRLEIRLEPLRRHREDVPCLVDYFLNMDRPSNEKARASADLVSALQRYSWPGNVRELRNTLERMRLMNSDKLYYDVTDLDAPGVEPNGRRAPQTPAQPPLLPQANGRDPSLKLGKSRVRRLALLRELFRKHEVLTRSEVIQTLEVSPNTASKDLRGLCEEGFITKNRPTASPRSVYFSILKTSAGG
ncbi:MAG: sigma-54 dependent transcriptional regulator [Kiritimatiellia bacterium]